VMLFCFWYLNENSFSKKLQGVIGEVRCDFLWIYTPIPYSAVFLLHALMHLHLLRSVLAWCRCVGAVLRFGLDSFRSDWTSPNVNFNLKNSPLQQHKKFG
jgi:hypothetical protein